ncbi:MAG TPA: TlpA disulfide reductase family protein [Pirellulaceae bacterium]|nr:TlpA disulfide reductase family protein [Pirellulaceae bacterium]
MSSPDAPQPSSFAESSAAERELHPTERRPRLWPWLVLAAMIAALIAVRTFAPPPAEPDGNGRRHPAVGKEITQVSLQPLTGGGPVILEADLVGKVTAINFWATWCGPCKMEFPELIELEEDFRSRRDFQFLSVSCSGPDDVEQLRQVTAAFLRQQRAEFRTLHDPGFQTQLALAAAASLDGFAYPTTVVIDRQGVIRGLWVGYAPGDERRVRAAIESALRNEPLPAAATPR